MVPEPGINFEIFQLKPEAPAGFFLEEVYVLVGLAIAGIFHNGADGRRRLRIIRSAFWRLFRQRLPALLGMGWRGNVAVGILGHVKLLSRSYTGQCCR